MIIECFNAIKFDAYIFLKNKNYHRQFIDEKKKNTDTNNIEVKSRTY